MALLSKCHCGRPLIRGSQCQECETTHLVRQQDDEFGFRFAAIREAQRQGLIVMLLLDGL